VGQVTTIGRAEGERAGNVLFAGEHCSRRFQGYMNGAAETGRRAAEDIATELGVSSFQSVRREKVSG
jgi:monoamine oxidase